MGYAPPVQSLNRLGSLKRGAEDRRKAYIKQLKTVIGNFSLKTDRDVWVGKGQGKTDAS